MILFTYFVGMVGKIGIKGRVDKRGRITVPVEFRELLGINPGDIVIIEKKGEELVISKPISPEEFLKEAEELQDKVKETKVTDVEVLKVKEMWK